MTRKEIVNVLDRVAERAILVEATPATPKQTWFLAGLIEKAGCEINDDGRGLTKKMASSWIEEELAR